MEDAAGALVISRAGAGCSAERRPTLGGRLAGPGPTGLAGPRLWGGGPLGSPGPGPGPPWCGRLPVEPAGLPPRHPGAPTLVAVGGPPSGSPLPFSGWRPRLSLRWFSWGSRALGASGCLGARVFSVPASCLAGWGCCSPHTLLNVYMEEPYEHKRAHTHRCTLKHSHWCKNRCSQTPIVLICCCFKTYFVILVMCAGSIICKHLEFIVIYTDVGCCCSLFDVVSRLFSLFVSRYRSKLSVFFFFFFFFFFSSLSLYPPFSFFSLSLPLLCWLSPQPFFIFIFILFFIIIFFYNI